MPYNKIGDNGAGVLTAALEKNRMLRVLNLRRSILAPLVDDNTIASAGAVVLAKMLGTQPSLMDVNLSSNCLYLIGNNYFGDAEAMALLQAALRNGRLASLLLCTA